MEEAPLENTKIEETNIKESITQDSPNNIAENNSSTTSETTQSTASSPKPTAPVEDPRMLVIKNLDTGEEFVIGENDPDFEFDTFEIGGVPPSSQPENSTVTSKNERLSWWRSLFTFIYGNNNKNNVNAEDLTNENMNLNNNGNSISKTPFTKLSSFKFRKELGRGAFGRVLLAEAKTDGTLYALKIIAKKNMRTSDKKQVKAERDILYAMTLKSPHPFTSGLKFAFQSENNLYLGMDYIAGGNLRQLIKRFKYLPENWVIFYAAELILAISHLHSLNVLYRDIKPHNVMIDSRGHVILIDFGLSRQEISHPRGALSLVGTPDYSAPEVLRTGVQQIEAHNRQKALKNNKRETSTANKNAQNKKFTSKRSTGSSNSPTPSNQSSNPNANGSSSSGDVRVPSHIGYGKAADWWSLGIMIYEMLCGKPTFRGNDLRETYQRILYSKLEFIPEDRFSPNARKLLEGLINRDPSARLGAWENPPKDIMGSPFFNNISWDAVYERRQDGPWIPEVPIYLQRKGVSSTPPAPTYQPNGDWTPFAFDPVPFDRMVNINEDSTNDKFKDKKDDDKKNNLAPTILSSPINNGQIKANYDKNNDDSDSDTEIPMRDSVFVSSGQQNRLADWSFIDENVLMSSIQNEREDNNNNNRDKKNLPTVNEMDDDEY